MSPHLEQFAHQLKSWAQDIIDHGRTPFRRVDCLPSIVTEGGVTRPPLIFWINRQSMMAGGIVLLPKKNLAEELQRGRHCAEALGLSHFVTWEIEQVRLWRTSNGEISEEKCFPLPGTDHPDFFQHLLRDLIDALKIPAVTGAIPQDQRSHHYFHNLFNIAEELALPALTDAFRSQRAEELEGMAFDVDQRALEANRLFLLQLLTALRFSLLPDSLLPEDLGEVVITALARAPEPFNTSLAYRWEGAPLSLPNETAICYHHLLLRLQQLRWTTPPQRMQKSLRNLLDSWYPVRGNGPMENADMLLYPRTPATNPNLTAILSDSPLLLAGTAVTRELAGLPQPAYYYDSLLSLTPETLCRGSVSAWLLSSIPISRNERAQFGARLRTSWPHRNFKILTDQPRWKWQMIHLLGICQPHQRLQIECPVALVEIASDDPLWALLCEYFHLREIVKSRHSLSLSLSRSPLNTEPTRIKAVADQAEVSLVFTEPEHFRRQLISVLQLSEPQADRDRPVDRITHQASKNVRQQIIEQLQTHGIPNFPDQYLYFLDHPDMLHYDITLPLKVTSRLLGQFDMIDGNGQPLSGYGEELEQALLLCSQLGKTSFDLPGDRQQLVQILQHYRKDLDSLHQLLSDLSYRQMEKPQAARNLVRNVWKKLALPDPEWFKN
ncbi:hypothetical protein [Pelovirga terrestris]|uniref:Uncharacterized protein n=1 Tax=Pelovirga terrestris TaxID=2771352 RepID=A0A8J6QML4_9BACT|nr:hypothetical protein [Pelovirga terrestris]MBD1401434.1 hypothetical protein [Pelovirga terrestris]